MGSEQVNAALETIILFTSQMEALSRFYEQGLSIGPYQRLPGHIGCQLGGVYFGFDQVKESAGRSTSGIGPTLWFTVDDIDASFKRLIELGAIARYAPSKKPWGATLASLEDPDGNVFGLSQRQSDTKQP